MADAAGAMDLGHGVVLLAAGVLAVPLFKRLGLGAVLSGRPKSIEPTAQLVNARSCKGRAGQLLGVETQRMTLR